MPSGSKRARVSRPIKQEAIIMTSRSYQGLSPPIEGDNTVNDSLSNASRRVERSNAPPPSEHVTEPDPLLIEVRERQEAREARNAASANSPANVEDSFFHTSFQDIGKKLKECNDTLGELQQLGVSHDVQLPELVLVGDQSAGKSSVMSGLANLDLPRSEGTCTRCPLHIRVSRNSEWSCRVWLRKEYTYQPPDDGVIRETNVTTDDPFFPWKKRPNAIIEEFKTMHDHSEIEDVLRWAQIAILNDDQLYTLFVPGSGRLAISSELPKAADNTAAKFSPNIVALEIKGPGLPDLSFYDMPGIFQNPADARDDYLVNVVSNLSRAYIKHPSAIIMCSMPMNSDAENSSTFGLIRRLGASDRTIGVLTKADLLPDGSHHDQWLSIMNGQTHRTGLGYFITSRPQGKDLEELKQWERNFFETHSSEKWPQTFHPFSSRCGVEKLKAFLSERLGEEFAKNLPSIKRKVVTHLEKIHRELSNLRELPENVELTVQVCLMKFTANASSKIDAFSKHFNQLPRSFQECLLHIKPKFTLKDRSDKRVFEISSDESDATSTRTPTGKRTMAPMQTPTKRPRFDLASSSQVKSDDAASVAQSPAAKRTGLSEPFAQFSNIGRGFRTLRQVQEEIEAKIIAGMPEIVSNDVYDSLIRDAIEPWRRPTQVFLAQTIIELQGKLDAALNESLKSLEKRSIYRESKQHTRQLLKEHFEATEAVLMQQYRHERDFLLTFNEEAFKQYRRDELMLLTRFRHNMRLEAAGSKMRPLAQWSDMTEDQRKTDQRQRDQELLQLGPDKFDRELGAMAYVRGYYRLAAMRFVDTATQNILCRMIPDIQARLKCFLEQKLGLAKDASGKDAPTSVYERLMSEDDATASNRQTLKAKLANFNKALRSIELFEAGTARVAENGFTESQNTQLVSQHNAITNGDTQMDEC